jgi:7,8-dihydropterin-6-yl-methyl-4-(beta-D-ribofuranosyl)aminobenzene 5'-phosphate synthase
MQHLECFEHVSITCLVENRSEEACLRPEHGLSLWIELDEYRVLFDAGATDLAVKNASQLGIDLSLADAIVISHGHYDHAGGLEAVLQLTPNARVFIHPEALAGHYKKPHQPAGRYIGIPTSARSALEGLGERLIYTPAPVNIFPGVTVTGTIARGTTYEDVGGAFYADADGKEADLFMDDQALFFRTRAGIVAIAGCAHSGIVNTLDTVAELADDSSINAIIGGLHLAAAGELRLKATVQALEKRGVARVIVGHCTGAAGENALRRVWHDAFEELVAGLTVTF